MQKPIPVELKFDENVWNDAKALGRLQGIVVAYLFYKAYRMLKANANENKD